MYGKEKYIILGNDKWKCTVMSSFFTFKSFSTNDQLVCATNDAVNSSAFEFLSSATLDDIVPPILLDILRLSALPLKFLSMSISLR